MNGKPFRHAAPVGETPQQRVARESYDAALDTLENTHPPLPVQLAAAIGAHSVLVDAIYPHWSEQDRNDFHQRIVAALMSFYENLGGKHSGRVA